MVDSLRLPVYLDHAATTPVAPAVLAAMQPFFSDVFANPAAAHAAGLEAREAVETSRETLARLIGADPEEITFTSGGTESDNLALKGVARAVLGERRHVLVSAIEHHAVLDAARALSAEGFDVETLPVTAEGIVEPEAMADRISARTALVSVMHANNEVGTVEPISEIGRICREAGVPFHVDAVQTFGRAPLDVRASFVDLASVSGHKLYGPKGIGALYVRRGVRLVPCQDGGEQERGRRAGTLNVPGIVGLAVAAEAACAEREAESARLATLRDRLMAALLANVPGCRISGSRRQRLPNNVHVCIEGVEGEPVLLALDAAGVFASAGSACSAGSTEPSHVLIAMGLGRNLARGALRLTLGKDTDAAAVEYAAEAVAHAVTEVRGMAATGS